MEPPKTDYIEIFIITVKIIGVLVTAGAGFAGFMSKTLEIKTEPAVSQGELAELLNRLHLGRKRFLKIAVTSVIVTIIAQMADIFHELAQARKREVQMERL